MNIPDTAFDAADKACQQYGDHQGMALDDESALSMDQLDLIADAIKAAAPFIAAQALRDAANEADEDGLTTAGEVSKDLRRAADKLAARA